MRSSVTTLRPTRGMQVLLLLLACISLSCQKSVPPPATPAATPMGTPTGGDVQTGTGSAPGTVPGAGTGVMMESTGKGTQSPTLASPGASAPSAAAAPAGEWKVFTHPGHAFQVLVPFEMKRRADQEEPGEEQWFGECPDFSIGAYFTTVPEMVTANKTRRKVLEISAQTFARGSPIDSQQFVTANGFEFLEFRTHTPKVTKTLRLAFENNALMEFAVTSPGTGSKDIEKKFFDSIQLTKP